MHKQKWLAVGVLGALVLAFGAGIYTGVTERLSSAATDAPSVQNISLSLNPDQQPSDVDFKQFWKAWTLLDRSFVNAHASGTMPTYQKRMYGAITGLTESYGDPYTVFLPPAEATTFQQNINGEFGGVGMELGVDSKGTIIVIAPLKDSAADKAGVKSGDAIIAIDGKSTEGFVVDDAVHLIRGEVGTSITITFMRGTETYKATIVRQTINIPIIKSEARSDGVFEIDLYSFSANSANLFRDALRKYFESGDTKLLLDLRGNPGGYLEAAVEMASFFLPVGDTVVTEDYKGKQDNVAHRSVGYDVFKNKKMNMAILIDQGSASASEILAGALQQHNVAKLVGTRSFGKGSVQQLMELGNGAELKVTVARWLTPNGSSISDGGLKPDINATTTLEDIKNSKDPQKSAAVLWLTQQ